MDIKFLICPDHSELAYEAIPGASPGVVFLGGFMSDMSGTKAQDLADFCRSQGRAFVRFDYFGHGQSQGAFTDGTIGRWTEDAIQVLDQLTKGPQILVGSSMGGWLMILAALARPERVRGMVGIASAPDFTEDLFWAQLPAHQRQQLLEQGITYRPNAYGGNPYPFTRNLLAEARFHLILRNPIVVPQPVRLIHGLQDADVPWTVSVQLAQALTSRDVRIHLIKGSDHRCSTPEDLQLIRQCVSDLW